MRESYKKLLNTNLYLHIELLELAADHMLDSQPHPKTAMSLCAINGVVVLFHHILQTGFLHCKTLVSFSL